VLSNASARTDFDSGRLAEPAPARIGWRESVRGLGALSTRVPGSSGAPA
jgi:hypothetical protein